MTGLTRATCQQCVFYERATALYHHARGTLPKRLSGWQQADAVTGVELAGDNDEKEVRTHEVPQDNVPGEYLDKE